MEHRTVLGQSFCPLPRQEEQLGPKLFGFKGQQDFDIGNSPWQLNHGGSESICDKGRYHIFRGRKEPPKLAGLGLAKSGIERALSSGRGECGTCESGTRAIWICWFRPTRRKTRPSTTKAQRRLRSRTKGLAPAGRAPSATSTART